MNLTPYVDAIRDRLAVAADAAGPEARAVAERLVAPLDAEVRLALLDALAAATAEITSELAPGSVELRLRGREPGFVVTLPPPDELEPEPAAAPGPPAHVPDGDESAMTRVNLRLGQDLKDRAETAARQAGISLNAWLVRSATAALGADTARSARRRTWGGDSYRGWVR